MRDVLAGNGAAAATTDGFRSMVCVIPGSACTTPVAACGISTAERVIRSSAGGISISAEHIPAVVCIIPSEVRSATVPADIIRPATGMTPAVERMMHISAGMSQLSERM